MDGVAKLLNEMVAAGIIADYAVFGAVAQMRYTEAVATLDAVIALSVGRSKDMTRVLALREALLLRRAFLSLRGDLAVQRGRPSRA